MCFEKKWRFDELRYLPKTFIIHNICLDLNAIFVNLYILELVLKVGNIGTVDG